MADELKASPQEPITGALAKALGWMAHPTVDGHEIKPHLNLPSLLLPLESGAKFFENRSYGKPWTTGAGGLGGTQNLAPDVRDFAMDVAPYVPDVARLAGKGAKAIGKGVGEAMSQFAPSGSGPKTLTSQVGAIKPKGGNWLTGNVEKSLEGLKLDASKGTPAQMVEFIERKLKDSNISEDGKNLLRQQLPQYQKESAINNWVDKNLTNYVKKEMGTPEDPVRKLAEEGILHSPMEAGRYRVPENVKQARFNAGFPIEGMGQSDLAKAWEHLSDASIKPQTVEQLINPRFQKEGNVNSNIYKAEINKLNNPWLEKLDPKDVVYKTQHPFSGLGFDHILDVLKEDVANGRLHHDNLKNVSMEQAVRRTHEYDQEMAKKMAEAQFKVTEGMPVHKEYPEGYKWIELAPPKELPAGYSVVKDDMTGSFKVVDASGKESVQRPVDSMGHTNIPFNKTEDEAIAEALKYDKRLEDALKYEGDTMGHCVGGYCPDVLEGRSRIYSLRDAKGEPHVTVEVEPNPQPYPVSGEAFAMLPQSTKAQYGQYVREWRQRNPHIEDLTDEHTTQALREAGVPPQPNNIIQIKGKGNKMPVGKYLPMVQDFVKSGDWGDVGDLHNTGLQKIGKEYLTQSEADAIYNPKIEQANKFLDTHPAFEPHRLADREYLDAIGKEFSTNDPVYTRHEMNELERRSLQPVHPEIPYTLNEMKAGLNRPEEYGSDNNYEFLDRRLNDIDKLRQIHGDVPPVEPTPNIPPPETPQFKRGGAVTFTDNPDAMMMEVNDRKFANGGESNVKQTPQQWIQGLANQPTEPWHPLDELTSNLQGIANLPSRMYEGAKSLYNDPMEYLKNIKAPTAEQVAMGFNPAGLETGLAGMAEKVGNLKAIDVLFPNKTENMLNSAEKSALTKYKKDLDIPAVMRRELFRTTGTGDIETPSLKMRPEKGLSPDYLEDKYVVPILWDTSGAGTNVSQIAGVPLTKGLRDATATPTQKQGGRLYPLIEENAQQGVGGASMESAASSKVNNLNTYSNKGPTVGVVMDMAEHGIDFSHHIAEPYIGMLNALRPSNDALKAFKQAVRETPVIDPITGVKAYPYTKFPGIDSPNIREIISKGTNDYSAGNIRKAIAQVGDTYAMEKLGFPKWSDIYKAMSMPDAKTGQSAKTILEVNPNTQLITPNFEHGSYNTGIGATYAGGLADVSGNIVGVPDTILLKRLFDERLKQGKTIGNVRSSLLKSHHGQLMTAEDVARLREYLGYDKPKKAEGGAVHMAGGGKVGLAKSAVEMMEEIMAKIGQKAIPVAEAEANKAKFLEPSKIKARMFHGSKQPNITEFKTRKQLHDENFPDDTSNHYADERDAVFLSPESDFTKHHSVEGYTDRESGEAPTTYPVHVQAKNPFDFEIPEHRENLKRTYADMYFNPESDLYIHDPYDTESAKTIAEKWFMDRIDKSPDDVNNWPLFENPKIQEAIKDMGHDSFYINERGTKNLGVFDPNTIKSAIGNQGTYDITNPDINKKKGGEVHLAGGGGVPSMEYEPEQVPVDFYKYGNKMMTGDADISMGGMGLASNLGNDSLSLALNSSDIKKYIGDPQMMNALMANYAHNMANTKLMANVMAPQGTPVKNINLMASTPVGGGTATLGAHGSNGFGQKQLNALSANYNLPLEHGNLNANVNRSLADKKNTVNLNYVMPFKNGGAVHMAGGGSASKALEAMLAEAPELANTIRGLFKAEAPTLGSLVDKLRTPDRQSVLPMPNRWFLDPENHPEVQGLVQKVLDANGMNRSDFHSGAYVDPKTGKIIDTQIHNDVGVAIDPITNRPVMTTGGVSGMEQLPSNWRDVGSATKSNLVKQGKFQPVGGDPILNDIGFLSTIEKSGAGHKYGLGMEYANPTMLHNTLTGDNPTLRPQSYGDLFGIGDVVGKIQTTKTGPIHDVYEKLLVAPKGSDVKGVKLNKKNGGKVTMTTNPDAMQMELHNKAFKRK